MIGTIHYQEGGRMWQNSPRMEELMLDLDDDLKQLAPEDLGRVRRWVEDRFVNAVSPLVVRLRLAVPGVLCSDGTFQAAQAAVDRIMAAVDEVRRMDDETEF